MRAHLLARRAGIVVAVAVLLTACGETPGVGGPATEAPPGGSAGEPGPTPIADLDGALARWADFPATAAARPIVLLTDLPVPLDGYAIDPAKLGFICGKTEATIASYPATPTQAQVRWPDGTITNHGALSAQDAVAAIKQSAGSAGVDCSTATPLTLTGVSQGTTELRTDRGTVATTGWVFTGPGVTAPGLAYPAIDPDAFWAVSASLRAGLFPTAELTLGERGLTVYFYGTPTGAGACTSEYEGTAAESASAVAVAIRELPPAQPRPTDLACTEIAQLRSVTVTLARPVGARVVIDTQAQATPVCPMGRVSADAGMPGC